MRNKLSAIIIAIALPCALGAASPTETPTLTSGPTPVFTSTVSASATWSASPSPTPTATRSFTASPSWTASPSPTYAIGTPTFSLSPTPSQTWTAGVSPSATPTPAPTDCFDHDPIPLVTPLTGTFPHGELRWFNGQLYHIGSDSAGLHVRAAIGSAWTQVASVYGAFLHPGAIAEHGGELWIGVTDYFCAGCSGSGSAVVYAFDGSNLNLRGVFEASNSERLLPVSYNGKLWVVSYLADPNLRFRSYNGSGWDDEATWPHPDGQIHMSEQGAKAQAAGSNLYVGLYNPVQTRDELWSFQAGTLALVHASASGVSPSALSLAVHNSQLYCLYTGGDANDLFKVDPSSNSVSDAFSADFFYSGTGPAVLYESGDGNLYGLHHSTAPWYGNDLLRLGSFTWSSTDCFNHDRGLDSLVVEGGRVYSCGAVPASSQWRITDCPYPTPSGCLSATATSTSSVSATPPATATPTATQTVSPSSTLTPYAGTPTPLPAASLQVDDFEDGDQISLQGGQWLSIHDGGSSCILLPAPGCSDGTALASLRCQGGLGGSGLGQYAGLSLDFSGQGGYDFNAIAGQQREFGFRAYSSTPLTLTVEVVGVLLTNSAVVYLDGNGWQNCTVANPDNQAPGDLPVFVGPLWVNNIGNCQALRFLVRQDNGSPLPFDFRIDDVGWRGLPGNCRTRVASAFGASMDDVQEAYSFGLTEDATWILLVLARHCGCHPHTVMALRATLSWGQIAAYYGLTWAATIDEAWNQADAAGLDPDSPSLDQMMQVLQNAVPTPQPQPTVTPYVPVGPLALPPAGGC